MDEISLDQEITACLRQGDYARAYDLIELRDAQSETETETSDA